MSSFSLTLPVDPGTADTARRMRDAATRAGSQEPPDELKRVCQEMESLFINQLLKQMRQTIPKDGLFGESNAEEMFTGMHDAELARKVAGAGGLGLAQILMNQLVPLAAAGRDADDGLEKPPLKVSAAGTDNPYKPHRRMAAQDAPGAVSDGPEMQRSRKGTQWK